MSDPNTSQPASSTGKATSRSISFSSCLLGGALTIILSLGFLAVLTVGGCYIAGESMKEAFNKTGEFQTSKSEEILFPGDSTNKIAVIYITDVIGANFRQTERTLKDIRTATNDHRVKAIVLYIDSPGGAVTSSDVIYHSVLEAKKNKPVTVYMDNIAASGGYYISCAANHITANANTLTGSIGVIISTINVTDVMNKVGVKAEVFTSGPFKDMLSMTKPISEAESTYVQSLVDEAYGNFLNIVSTGRGISIQDLQKKNAVDGRIITGKHALEIGLVDANGYFDDAIQKAAELAKVEKDFSVIRYKRNEFETLFSEFLSESKAESKIKVELSPSILPQLQPGIPYLLPPTYAHGAKHE